VNRMCIKPTVWTKGCVLCGSWFHANVPDMKSAETLLLKEGYDGSYLVRRSKSTKGAFSLAARSVHCDHFLHDLTLFKPQGSHTSHHCLEASF